MDEELSTRERLLDAALETAAVHGLAKLSVGDVAKRAGLSRQTLYKHFASREELVDETILREAQRMVVQIVGAAEAEDDPEQALEVGILTTLRVARDHPLLDRLVRTEPESLLPLLIADGGSVTTAVRAVVEGIIDRKVPGLSPLVLRRVADMVSRLLVSYAVNAPDDPPEEVARTMARVLVGRLEDLVADDRAVAPGHADPPAP